MSTYRFRAPAPIRALAIGATLSVFGAFAAVVALVQRWPVGAAVPGFVLLALGVIQVLGSLVQQSRQHATVTLSDEGWQVQGPRGVQSGRWADVTRVATTDERSRLSIESTGGVVHVVRPVAHDSGVWEQMVHDLTRRLDADRGYRQL